MSYETYEPVTGTIQEIRRGNDCCGMILSILTEQGVTEMTVSGETRIIDDVPLRRGMRVAAFFDVSLPAPAIYPPRYQAELIISLKREQTAVIKYFDENLMAEDGSLQLNPGPFTQIRTLNGQRFPCRPGNQELLVCYTVTTFSIPPQTTPQVILVMCS